MVLKTLNLYLLELDPQVFAYYQIGICARNTDEALHWAWALVFHNQTIPSEYTIRPINPREIRKLGLPYKNSYGGKAGIWFPEHFFGLQAMDQIL